MFKRINEFEKNYSTLFFCISLLVIIVFLAYFSVLNREKNGKCVVPNNLVNNTMNYSYNVIYSADNKNVKLYIKRYDKKYLIEKEEDGMKSSYYLYYTDILERATNGEYIKFRNDNIVSGLDNKFLLLDYINDISLQSSIKKDNELTCYVNRKLDLSMCINLDDSITLKTSQYNIVYEVIDSGNVNDFNVNIGSDLNYEDNSNVQ